MKLFLFVKLFFLISFGYAVREDGESSSRPIDLNQDLSKFQDSDGKSSSPQIDLNQGSSKIQDSDCFCRLGSSKRIINGEEAKAHLVPWQVSLANSTGYHFCGAIIVNHHNILTSAKCLRGMTKDDIKVRVGVHNINEPIPSKNIYDVELIDGFNFYGKYGGMAVLILKTYIEFIPGKVEPACLDFFKEESMKHLMVSGWGHTSEKKENTETKEITFGTLSPVLKIGYLYEKRHSCRPLWICACSLNGDLPCIADNGGPLHFTKQGLTMVEGVLLDRFSEIGIAEQYHGKSIFLRFSAYENWIKEKIGEDYCAKDRALNGNSKRKIESFDSFDDPEEKVGEPSSILIDLNQDSSKIQDSDCSCRLGSSKRIINGEEAEAHLVPWQVSLANSTGYHFCGAIIVNHHNILTSAKCVKDMTEDKIKVRVGVHNINEPIPSKRTYDVELVDGFNFNGKYGGMAVLILKTYIEFIPGKVEPACLDLVKGKIIKHLMVSGWGHTSEKKENTETKEITFGTLSPVLKIGYLQEDRCDCGRHCICTRSLYGDLPYIGDNGGPLHFTKQGLTMVEGVLLDSLYEFSSTARYNGLPIFSRLSFYKKWIIDKIGEDYCANDRALNGNSKRKIESFDDPKGKKKLKLY